MATYTQTVTFVNGNTADGGQVNTEIVNLGASVNNIVAAQLALANNEAIQIKDSGGTKRNIVNVDASNVLQIGSTAGITGGVKINLTAGASFHVLNNSGTSVVNVNTSGDISQTNAGATINMTGNAAPANPSGADAAVLFIDKQGSGGTKHQLVVRFATGPNVTVATEP